MEVRMDWTVFTRFLSTAQREKYVHVGSLALTNLESNQKLSIYYLAKSGQNVKLLSVSYGADSANKIKQSRASQGATYTLVSMS
jgi:hypothetical protein